MEHFRVLPSDRRLEQLTDEQIDVLFVHWLDFDEDMSREAYRKKRSEEEMKPRFDPEQLRALGYGDAEIHDIVRSLDA